jgi:hypothetical protein
MAKKKPTAKKKPVAKKRPTARKKNDDVLRLTARQRIALNPNYFGNLTELEIPNLPKPKLKKVSDKSYEELTCIGYNPDTRILSAIVRIKRGSGYSGGPCTDGSDEFVRFYLDYGDGNWVDHGVAGFDVHDLGFDDDLCYAVSIQLSAKKRSCCDDKPVLPHVRAILSWNTMPPASTPGWLPVWGNRLERRIQIKPRSRFLCQLLPNLDVGVQKIDPSIVKKLKEFVATQPSIPQPPAPLDEVIKASAKEEMGEFRAVFPLISKMSTAGVNDMALFETLSKYKLNLSKFDDFIAKPNFNTHYEELRCVGLDRDTLDLHGVIEIKRSSGYSGNLCTKGSQEYVAFYLDFGSGWEYIATGAVTVHDVAVPRGGLWYQVKVQAKDKIDPHRQEWCKTGKARIRGILSWASPPPPHQPNFVPHWGDREDCCIEVVTLPEGVVPGHFFPVLQSIGNMSIGKIVAGYANGSSVGGGFVADDAPFGGTIQLKGTSFNVPPGAVYYRIWVRRLSDLTLWNHVDPFDADVTTFPNPTPATQTITPVGEWYPYVDGQPNKAVAGGLLGVLKGLQNELHEVWVDFHDGAGGPHLAATAPHQFMVDNTAPVVDVEITSGTGNCGKFGVGDVISGTYSMVDDHPWYMTIRVTPLPEAAPGVMDILPDALAPVSIPVSSGGASASLSYAAGTLATNGSFGTWELDTTGMPPCGYNVRIVAEDRTIVNSTSIGWPAGDIEGFCLDN